MAKPVGMRRREARGHGQLNVRREMTHQEACEQLSSDYAAFGDLAFTLQPVIDAYAAQHADRGTKPITLFFALVGLCLRVEKGLSGRQVQRMHQLLAQRKQSWPIIEIPAQGAGAISAVDVVARGIGAERDAAVDPWCASVWSLYRGSHELVRREMRTRGIAV